MGSLLGQGGLIGEGSLSDRGSLKRHGPAHMSERALFCSSTIVAILQSRQMAAKRRRGMPLFLPVQEDVWQGLLGFPQEKEPIATLPIRLANQNRRASFQPWT